MNDLILVLQGREVWRISATGESYEMKKTRLFKLYGMFAAVLSNIQVYDTFAVINFAKSSLTLAIRPETEGDYAIYNEEPTEVGGVQRHTIHLSSINQKPIDFKVVADRTKGSNNYLLNMITEDTNDGTQYLVQEGIEIDSLIPLALFTQTIAPK